MLTAILQMENKRQFPSAFGRVDGCHISIKCPSGGNEARKEYYNFKNFYSIVIMGIVGLPGNSNDACSFQASRLYQNIAGNDFLPEIQKIVTLPNGNELQLPPILLGDSAFPNGVWLQKPFGNTTLYETVALQLLFEQDKNGDRMCFWSTKREMATSLQEGEVNQHSLKVNILACIVLHNICIEKRGSISRKLDLPYDKNDNTRKSPEELRRILKMVSSESYLDTSKGAAILRNNICDYLWSKKKLYNYL